MAGIGFRLRRLLDEGTYSGTLKGFLYATYLVAGPWIVTVAVIGLLTTWSGLQGSDYWIFRTAIVYCYAFSLIFTGIYQMPLTRHIADELFLGRVATLAPAYLGMSVVTVTVLGSAGMFYSLFLPLSWLFRCTFAAGMATVGLLWLAGVFLSCLRNYQMIGLWYVIGSCLSFAGTIQGQRMLGLDGAFLGFVAGQAVILFGLSYRIIAELGLPGLLPSFTCLESLGRFRHHLLIGLFYSLTIWIDKMIYWFSPMGESACGGLYSFGIYDSSIYIAYVTIIPALGVFMLQIETTFYESYRDFYGAILRQFNLETIYRRREEIVRNLGYSFFELIKIQGAVTILCFYFAPELLSTFGFPPELSQTVRWGVWAAFFQVIFLFVSLILLYFEFTLEALAGNALHLLINAGGTWYVMAHRLSDWYAAGYLAASVIGALFCAFHLRRRLDNLVRITFLREAIPGEAAAAPPLVGPDGRLGEIILRRNDGNPGQSC